MGLRLEKKTINICRDFSIQTYGKHRKDGPYSAEAFREDLLIPALCASDVVVIELDDSMFCVTAMFAGEAFGGLVKYNGFLYHGDLERRIVFVGGNRSDVILCQEAMIQYDGRTKQKRWWKLWTQSKDS